MESFLTDLRYGAKSLWKNRGLTIIAVISLAAGIGANSAIFSIVNSMLFRPRPVSHPEQLAELYAGDNTTPYQTVSYPSYLDFRNNNRVFSGLAAYGIRQFKITRPDDVLQVWGEAVSGNYFDVLGVRPFAGRTFAAEEDQAPGRNPVAVIGYALWQRQFAGNPAIVGTTVTINRQRLTVIGIAPPEYTGMMRGISSELWVPVMMMPLLEPSHGGSMASSRGSKWAILVGRLLPGATIEQAREQFAALSRGMQAEHPDEWVRGNGDATRPQFVSVLSEKQTRVHPALQAPAYAFAALLFVIVDLVLVIACMNLMSMLLARAVTRRSEFAVRVALGAGRMRIIRQLLTESLLLSIASGVIGIVFATWSLNLAVAFIPDLPTGLRLAIDVHLDWRVVAFSVAVAAITGVLFGLAPALNAARTPVSTVLKDGAGTIAIQYFKSPLRRFLIVAQVAFSVLLLIGAGLVLRSLNNVEPLNLGYATENVVVAPISLEGGGYNRAGAQQFYQQLRERLGALPGVRHVTFVDGLPGGFLGSSRRSTEIEGYTPAQEESMEIAAAIAGPGYFTSMNVPFVEGRDFSARDDDSAPCVAIVNEAFGDRYLGGRTRALGKHLARYDDAGKREMCEITGVIHDNVLQSLDETPQPFYALPLFQTSARRTTMLFVTTDGSPAAVTPAVRQTIRSLDANIPVADVRTLAEQFAAVMYPFRILALVIGACGALALMLATLGIYGLIAYSIAQRRREVGIRVALGAMTSDIVRLIVGQGMRLVGYGLAAGLLLSVALTRVLTSLPADMQILFGVGATDVLTFVGVTALLALTALVACMVPARRAARIDPVVALRS